MRLRVLCIALAALLGGCVSFPDAPPQSVTPTLEDDVLVSFDGARLGLTAWEAQSPRAIIIALHGMNDYSNAFALPGAWWAERHAITTYALDQRGFGRSPDFGRWLGRAIMIEDLRASITAVRTRHPGLPVFVLGHSMGAGVVMAAYENKRGEKHNAQNNAPLEVDGLILAAPGVWGGAALPIPYRLSVNIAAAFAPGKTLSGERAGRQSTDNIELFREMGQDPLMIEETRLDAILGVVRVMGTAYSAADEIDANILYLMGDKDEIIPLKAMEKSAMRLSGDVTIRRYPQGWHLLLRDLQAPLVWRDIADWVTGRLGDKAR